MALAWVGARLPTPSRVAAPRSARSAAFLRGASAAAGWRLCAPGKPAARPGPRGGARRRPPRPEADSSGAAPPASPGPRRRRGPPAPPTSAPPLCRPPFQAPPSLTLAECSGEWARGPPPRVNPLARGLAPPFPNSHGPRGGRVCPLRGVEGSPREDCPPQTPPGRLTGSAEKKNYFLADSTFIHRVLSPRCGIAFSVRWTAAKEP